MSDDVPDARPGDGPGDGPGGPGEPGGHPLRGAVRTLGRAQVRDILLLCLADGLVGASFGAITVAAGLPWWYPTLLSVVVFGGASQFLVVGVLGAGGSPIAAAAAAILVNARHVPFGFAVRDAVGSGLRRLVGTHLMIDESVAWAVGQPTPERRRAAFWLCGSFLFVFWNVGVALGALGGSALTSTSALGLDAAFPAVLLALVMPSLRQRRTRRGALVGAGVAVVTTPLLPAGLPVLLALSGLAARGRRASGRAGDAGEPTAEARPDDPAGGAA